MKKRYLILSDGQVFEGEAFGADVSAVGELVFNTGVCAYNKILTDGRYRGQIVMQTFPLAGNYGVIPAEFEGTCCLKGFVVREWCDAPSNFRAEETLDAYLKRQGVPGISGVETREITRILRENGVMNAMIADEVPADLSAIREYKIAGAVKAVQSAEKKISPAEGEKKFTAALIDLGHAAGIAEQLTKRGCEVWTLTADTTAEAVEAMGADGVVLSGGPGDPAENGEIVAEISRMLGKIPMFGVGLGHQLIALAAGAKTEKLKYGHRGSNQPVRDLQGTRTYITNQNHGYAVAADSLEGVGVMRYANANDGSCEGVDYPGKKAFSVQFVPETCAGAQDMSFIYDRFAAMMGGAPDAAE